MTTNEYESQEARENNQVQLGIQVSRAMKGVRVNGVKEVSHLTINVESFLGEWRVGTFDTHGEDIYELVDPSELPEKK